MKFVNYRVTLLLIFSFTFSSFAQNLNIDNVTTVDVSDCYGGSNGSLTIHASGGTKFDADPPGFPNPYYEYSIDGSTWQKDDSVFTGLSSLIPSYTVYVKDIYKTVTSWAFIDQPYEIQILTEDYTNVTGCYGDLNGTITVTAQGGTGALVYSINNGVTYPYTCGNTVSGLVAGTYNIKVRDANMCVIDGSEITITQPLLLEITDEDVTDILGCYGADNGTISITTTGGTSPIEYSIDGGGSFQSSNFFSGLAPGNYPVVVRDDNTCTTTGSTLTVNGPDQVTIDSENWTDINTCFGDNTGTITIAASGGTGNLFYSIDGGVNWEESSSGSFTFTNLYAGSYEIEVQDVIPCNVIGSTIIIDEPAQIVINSISETDVTTCFGDATGQIIIYAQGGIAPLEYSIDNGTTYQFSNIFNGITGGTYTCKVIDANACDYTPIQSVLIEQPVLLNITEITTTDVSTCFGENDGTMHIVTNGGGTSPYNFSIDGGATYPHGNSISGLSAGIYDVWVMDSHNCTDQYTTEVVEIGEPEELIIISEVPTDPTCYEGANGKITVTASGGTGQIQYSANAGANYYYENILVGLSVAENPHVIWVKDARNCITYGGSHNLSQPTELVIDNVIKEDVSDCSGGSNGSITIIASGGTPAYLYSIDGGNTYQSSNYFPGLDARNYQIIVKDANDCETVGDNITISQPDALVVAFQSHVNILDCHGSLTGEIHIVAHGGTPHITNGYKFSVNGGLYLYNNGNYTGLAAGTYDIIVQDENDCLAYADPVTITEPDILELDTISTLNIDCYGNAAGNIILSAAGGQIYYSYSIDGGSNYSSGSFFNGLIAGDYQTYVKDHYNCEVAGPLVTLTQPDSLSIDAVNVTDVEDCYGDNDGTIDILVSGGETDYLYSIDNGNSYYDNGGNFTNLEPGNYYIRIEDSNYCEAYLDLNDDLVIDIVEITEPPRLMITDIIKTDILCFGDNDGVIEIISTGGTGTTYYSIDNGTTYPNSTGIFTNLGQGAYIAVAMDDNSCESDPETVNIYEPDLLDITNVIVEDEECPDYNNGSINIFIDGGTYPFRFSATGGTPYQSDKIVRDLAPGNYIPTVIDANDCTAIFPEVTIEEAIFSASFSTDITEGCSPLEVQFTELSPETLYKWYFGDGTDTVLTENPSHIFYNNTLDPIIYTVTAISIIPCTDTTYTNITVYPQPQLNFTFNPDTAYFPESTVTIINNSPTGYINYNWDLGDGTSSTEESPGTHYYDDCGDYTIVMSADNTWCEGSVEQTFVVTAHQPEALFVVDTMQSCVPVTINFENRSEYYDTFEWNLGDGTVTDENDFSHTYDIPGIYNVIINTIGYCDTYDSYSLPITVFQSPIVDFDVSPDTVMLPGQPIHCYNSSSEDSDLFFWEFGDGGTSYEEYPVYQYTEAGSYYISLTVTSVNNCIDSLSMLTEVIVLPEGQVLFPNAFTPNGDGINDEFKPAVYSSVKNYKMEIFNRWGERMFFTDDINTGWDGYIDGALVMQDVYVWRVEGIYLNGTPYILSGSLTLLR